MKSCKIAVASTFSPRFLSVLAEAARLAKGFEGSLHIIHAAEQTAEKETRFREGFATVGLPENTPVFWVNASTPMEAILSAVEHQGIEILIAGALEREPEHRNFTGNVARNLLLKCHCDLVLLTRPEKTSLSVARIALAIDLMDPDLEWLGRALTIAHREGQPLLNVFSIVTPFDKLRDNVTSDSPADLEARMEAMVKEAGGYKGEIDYRVIISNTGFNACEVIQALEPNLLLARRSKGAHDELSLPTHMDWLPQVIPANAMIFAVKQ
ncbi:MAG: universal stress protein [Chthoniobacterales bacterium]